ncbi:hypothetical protein GCM10010174_60950 [Kutzneria viridogrisea]
MWFLGFEAACAASGLTLGGGLGLAATLAATAGFLGIAILRLRVRSLFVWVPSTLALTATTILHMVSG